MQLTRQKGKYTCGSDHTGKVALLYSNLLFWELMQSQDGENPHP